MNAYFPVVNEHISKRGKKVYGLLSFLTHELSNYSAATWLRCCQKQGEQTDFQA